MDRYAIDDIRSNLQDYLEKNGIRTDKFFRCINPEHVDSNASMKYFDDNKIYCFGCNTTYDLIDAISILENVDKKQAFKRAIDYYGKHSLQIQPKKTQKTIKKEEKNEKNYTKAYNFWKKSLFENPEAQSYLSARGIDEKTAERFNLGFNSFDFGTSRLNAVIIPVNSSCFTARNIKANEEIRYYKPKGCHIELFNTNALTNESPLCVIAEGEFDSLSFETLNINSIGLGSVSNINKFMDAKKDLKKTYIIALDNDEAGQKATESLKDYFKENKIKYKTFDNCGFKDPNEALVKDKNAFEKGIFSLIKKIENQSACVM